MSFALALGLAASALMQAVPDCESGRDGAWVQMPDIVKTKRLSEMLSDDSGALKGKTPYCRSATLLDSGGQIVLVLRYTGCWPGTVWYCQTGAMHEREIAEDLSKIVCQLPQQFDTCTTY